MRVSPRAAGVASRCLGTSPRRPSLQVDSGGLLGPLTCVLGRRGQACSRLTVPRVLGQACTLSSTGQVRGSCRTPTPPTSESTSTDPRLHLPCRLWNRTHHLGRPSPGANSPIASLAAQPGRALTDGDPGAPAHGSGCPRRHERAGPDVLLSCCSSFHRGLDTAGQTPDSDTSSGHTVCWLSPHFTKSTQHGRCHVWPCARGLGCPRERGCEVEVLQGRHRPEQTRSVRGQGAPPRPQSQVCTRAAQPVGSRVERDRSVQGGRGRQQETVLEGGYRGAGQGSVDVRPPHASLRQEPAQNLPTVPPATVFVLRKGFRMHSLQTWSIRDGLVLSRQNT